MFLFFCFFTHCSCTRNDFVFPILFAQSIHICHQNSLFLFPSFFSTINSNGLSIYIKAFDICNNNSFDWQCSSSSVYFKVMQYFIRSINLFIFTKSPRLFLGYIESLSFFYAICSRQNVFINCCFDGKFIIFDAGKNLNYILMTIKKRNRYAQITS